ncbi:MAG: hypothetical protein COC14_01405 [Burkholderiaceae bacterium]|jgi:hypothetical protein|uniref:Uncharacterized protein n=1 Tax=Cupriavidus metallidurans TaxID=119219 RepID=A0A482IQ76_9BURK|nr:MULTISPECIES: hypothetical protein [Cupriavidus]KWR79720.1 hypothetical protein RN01_20405 [Cupriavidus sp. SHE]PCH58505.1 MAG: hypothetical protein COC14_01405 [Burkholderiaceae bacterium]QBP09040.1 hypothetical protein DDF84_004345 [Cupriavidus metallidurans]QWC89472.1 hypothetical protein KB891_04495 [Cupriavidus metallidurans]
MSFIKPAEPTEPTEFPGPVSRTIRLAAGQCFFEHLSAGTIVHVEGGCIVVTTAPRWLASDISQAAYTLHSGGVQVIQVTGWTCLAAKGPAHCRIMVPAPRPGWWRLIKSRFGRSGFLLGNSRPPDTKATEPSVPHATSQ